MRIAADAIRLSDEAMGRSVRRDLAPIYMALLPRRKTKLSGPERQKRLVATL
jgi:hypothetical protein